MATILPSVSILNSDTDIYRKKHTYNRFVASNDIYLSKWHLRTVRVVLRQNLPSDTVKMVLLLQTTKKLCHCSGTPQNHGSLLIDTAPTILFNSIGEQRKMASIPRCLILTLTPNPSTDLFSHAREPDGGATPPRLHRRPPPALHLRGLGIPSRCLDAFSKR